MGLDYFEQKKYKEAVNRFQLSALIDSSNAKGIQKLADAWFMTARYYEARKAYLKVLIKEPENLTIKNNLAEIYFIQKQYQKAIDLCDEILMVRKIDINSLMRRAYAYDALGNSAEAVKDYEALVDMNPTPKLLSDFGLFYFRQDECAKAIECFSRAIDISSNKFDLYRYLGETNWRLRDYEAMAKWYQKIVESSPDDLLGWKNLALAYEALGQRELLVEAQNHINKITQTN